MAREAPRTKNLRVLIVDDNQQLARGWQRLLQTAGCDVAIINSWERARQSFDLACWRQRNFDVVILDLKLGDGDGRDLMPQLERLLPRPAVAVVSASMKSVDYLNIQSRRALAMPKPFGDPVELVTTLYALQGPDVKAEVVNAFAQLHELSDAQTKVLQHTASGLHVNEVADALKVKATTVSTQWGRIFKRTPWNSQIEVLAALFRFATTR